MAAQDQQPCEAEQQHKRWLCDGLGRNADLAEWMSASTVPASQSLDSNAEPAAGGTWTAQHRRHHTLQAFSR